MRNKKGCFQLQYLSISLGLPLPTIGFTLYKKYRYRHTEKDFTVTFRLLVTQGSTVSVVDTSTPSPTLAFCHDGHCRAGRSVQVLNCTRCSFQVLCLGRENYY